ncbi:hybrid sensor histidine kinase/response regulator [Bdellovibrio sp. ZAP7]|uniref:hybrid sensor histidine kinase/response regulator n=1 Tax=Bdellovibrio sp. ZAP7 TaxID=2231053 RepID=UPI001159EBBF|nr:hybrid sensor histidine kinase/response regulator [Bdellovibrio sp. ZAP7]QDK47567.1 hybrid sensor histidine kinase/response regulator [Bdellovibrio sp. ZAP7]
MSKHTILCVDDEIDNVEALERLFRKKYTVLKATSGKQALEVLDQHRGSLALIITDQRMPEMTGVEFLEKTLESHPETVRILLTGYTDLESVISAVNKGQIFRYITKPWDPVDLANTVDHAVDRFALGQELKTKNSELAKALDELKSLDVAKSNFMILINHELKTPLTSILSFSALLSESALADEDKLMVNRISRSADRLKNLVDDVLLIVRAETNQLKIDVQNVSFSEFSDLPKEVVNLLNQKNITIGNHISPNGVLADVRLVKQIMQRLIHNAAKFCQDGTEIEVKVAPEANVARFSVTNRGPHLSSKVVEKIMKPFYIDEDVMHHSSGTGLGLTICQAILKAHGSHLQFKNTDQGVMVSFELPLANP